MAVRIRVVNETGKTAPSIDWEALFGCAEMILGSSVRPLTLIFVSFERGESLNKEMRGKNGATNSLSFVEDREIVITLQVVLAEAKKQNMSLSEWVQRLVVHGILHLEGYTHDTAKDSGVMERLEQRILEKCIHLKE